MTTPKTTTTTTPPTVATGASGSEGAAGHPIVSAEALEEIYAHARRDYPDECCGIIHGPKGSVVADRAVACANIQNRLHAEDPIRFERDARTAYNLDAPDLFKLQRSLRGDSPAKIVYHSHVDVGAYFSKTDEAAALFDGQPSYPVEYVVIDVKADGARGAVQFAWDAQRGAFVEVARY
jgi:adenylyltransferase/sulfurtransferase